MPNSEGLYTLVSDTSIVAIISGTGIRQEEIYCWLQFKEATLSCQELLYYRIGTFWLSYQITGVYFECYCDHSALTYILNSKRKINSVRLDKLVRALNRFNFSIYYLLGTKMHIADVLSRLAGRDLDPPDKVFPICFNALKSLPPRRQLPQ